MKKIFATIIALAALVSCNTEAVDEVVSTPQYLTTSLEVDLDGDTRVFDNNLVWSWESTDEIAAYQVAGDQIVNTLTHKDNGSFGTDDFKYAVTEPADFKFVYPAAALNDDKTLGYVQTGKWTPTLVGTVVSTTVKDVNSQTITMEHYSAALEIRVFFSDGETKWPIKSATINTTTKGGVSASLENIGESSVVFNVASGDYIYDITLVDMNGSEFVIDDRTISFVRGKRTILNVQWTPTISFDVSSWWVDRENCPDGSTIYFTTLNCNAKQYDVLLDSNPVTVTDNKITDVASGMHKVKIRVPKKAGGYYYSDEKEVVVTSIPTLSYSIYSSYNSSDNSVNKDNSKDGRSLYCKADLSDTYIKNNTTSTTVWTYNDATASLSLGTTKQLSGLTLGQYKTKVECTLKNGYVLTGTESNIDVTGIPYTLNPAANDSWNAWSEKSSGGGVKWNKSSAVRLGYNQADVECSITKRFHMPAETGVKINSTGTVCGSGSLIKVNTTFTISVSGKDAYSVKSTNGKETQNFTASNATGTMTSDDPTIKCASSYNLATACVHIKSLTVQYQ